MMNKLFASALLMALGFAAQAQSPSSNQNYVMETTVKVPGKTTAASLAGLPVGQVNRTIQYFDGLGRPLQTVTWQGSSDGKKDVVQVFEYDALGREAKKYLPYAEQTSADGSYKPNGFTNQSNYYGPSTWDGQVKQNGNPYSITKFEPSPLNRVERQGFPGAVWQPSSVGTEHTGRVSYGTNNGDTNYGTTGFAVRLFKVSGGSLTSSGFYAANQLYLTISKDENWQASNGKWGTIEEYKDKEGRIVLKRLFNEKLGNTEVLSTYYVYDDLGNLGFVLPPGANPDAGVPDATALEQFCYQYKYDGLRRTIAKHIPGKIGWEEMVYNKLDQIVLSRDPKLALEGKWLFSKYDAIGRTVMTGMLSNSASRVDMQNLVDAESDGVAPDYPLWESRETGSDYSNLAYPRSYDHLLTVDYYDDYSFPSYSTTFNFVSFATYADKSNMTRGLNTGGKVRNLSTGEMMLSVTYYDDKGRAIQVHSENHLGGLTALNQGTDRVDTEYDFDGSVKKMERRHKAYGATTTVLMTYIYDHMGRKKVVNHSINGAGPVTLSEEDYNEVGQLSRKKIADGMQTTVYSYNERGWLKRSNGSPQLNIELKYEDGAYPQYNGNISAQAYTNASSNIFNYQYDKLNRLLKSEAGNNLGETISYDLMGNIKSMTRDGYGMNSYDGYIGNKLTQINGFTTGGFSYDVNGNVKTDTYRNITDVGYNYLNLPQTVTGSVNLIYTYDALGTKLRKVASAGAATTTTDYVSGIQYANGVIDFIQTGEGVALNSGGSYTYRYNLTDYLGNVRYVFDIYGGSVRRLQQDDYYAFGLRKSVGSPVTLENKYLYNGKELQEELEQYDYGARFYDPVIGRFNTVDPLSEISRRNSPYNYALNNPVRFIDVDGMYADDPTITTVNKNGGVQTVSETAISKEYSKEKDGVRTVTTTTTTASQDIIQKGRGGKLELGDATTTTTVTTATQTYDSESKSWVNNNDSKTSSSTVAGIDHERFTNVGDAANTVKDYGIQNGRDYYTNIKASGKEGMETAGRMGGYPLLFAGLKTPQKDWMKKLGVAFSPGTAVAHGARMTANTPIIMAVGSYKGKVQSFHNSHPPEVRAAQNMLYNAVFGVLNTVFKYLK